MGIIRHNEQLKFGKYKGLTLSQVCQKDSSYVNWLIENVMENVFELFDINYWTDVYEDYHNILPKDGLYLLAFRADNHISYEIEYHTAGTDIQDFYPLDGRNRNWGHCLAYYYIPEFSESDNRWKCHIRNDNDYSLLAVRNVAKEIKYLWEVNLFDYEKTKEEEWPESYCFEKDENGRIQLFDEGCIVSDEVTFLGEFYMGGYSENHHGNHNCFHDFLQRNNESLMMDCIFVEQKVIEMVYNKRYNQIFDLLDCISLPKGAEFGITEANWDHPISQQYVSLASGKEDNNIFNHLIVVDSPMGAWQVCILFKLWHILPLFDHAKYERRTYINQTSDITNVFSYNESETNNIRQTLMNREPIRPHITRNGNKYNIEQYYWNDWEGLVREVVKVSIDNNHVGDFDVESAVEVTYDCGIRY